jgi:hypothetical protein
MVRATYSAKTVFLIATAISHKTHALFSSEGSLVQKALTITKEPSQKSNLYLKLRNGALLRKALTITKELHF